MYELDWRDSKTTADIKLENRNPIWEVIDSTTENIIPWSLIDINYEYARMNATKQIYVYKNSPQISSLGDSWIDILSDRINITNSITVDTYKLNWETFFAIRPTSRRD